ncbi:MAG: hypothetical protein P8P30_00200 [Rickettsiales bacterium]|nr:hypothetical protein [Rickettsiales bacterium]
MPYLIVLGVGAIGGLYAGKGLDSVSGIVKWGVIGAGGYLAAKHFKVI